MENPMSLFAKTPPALLWAALLLAFGGACEPFGDTPAELGWSIADSAGVRIVTNQNGTDIPEAFRISPVSLLDLGGDRGGSSAELNPRHSDVGVARLSDGRFVVSDWQHIKVFGPDGDFQMLMGGPGEGPGEFTNLRTVCVVTGDTIVAVDGRARVSVFTEDGQHVRTFQALEAGRFAGGSCRTDGSLLFKGIRQPNPASTLPAEIAGQIDPVVEVRWVHVDSRAPSFLGLFPDGMLGPWFPSRGNVVAHEDEVFVGSGKGAEVRVYSERGAFKGVIRWDEPVTQVTDRLLAEVVQQMQPRGAPASEFERDLNRARQFPQPEALPVYETIRVDEAGRLWVQDYFLSSPQPQPWIVFDSEGVLLGKVLLPELPGASFLDVRSVSSSQIFLRWKDEVGFSHLTLHAFEPIGERNTF